MRRFLLLSVVALALAGGWLGVLAVRADRGSLPAGSESALDVPFAERHTVRIASGDPYSQAAAVSQASFPATGHADQPAAVVLARASRWQDLLVASRLLAQPFDAPLLLLDDSGRLADATDAELLRLRPAGLPLDSRVQAIVLGDLSGELSGRLDTLGYRRRVLAEDDPAALAAAVDDYRARIDGGYANNVLVVSQDEAAYALAAAAWAARTGDAILFTGRDQVPDETLRRLRLRSRPSLYVLGPGSVISESVASELASLGPVQRIGGDDPAATAVAFARFRDPANGFGWGVNAAGATFIVVPFDQPEVALPAAGLARQDAGGPLLPLARIVPMPVGDYLESLRPVRTGVDGQRLNRAFLVADVKTIPEDAQTRLDALLHWGAEP